MKKIYLSLLTVLTGLSVNAQLTQAVHAPSVGYTYQMYQCDSLNINPGASGANASWNFASIVTHSNILSTYVTSAASNPSYPTATVAVAYSANNTSYYNSTATALNYFGGNITAGAVQAAVIYTNAAVFAVYPMALNTMTNSAIAGSVSVTSPLPASGTFTGNCHVMADGTGTLTLPGTNTTFTNALRVMTSQTLDIVTSFANATLTQVTYDYYSVDIRNPLFTIATATAVIGGPFGGTTTQTIVTRDKNANTTTTTTPTPTTTVGLAENEANAVNFSVYPNPSASYVNFTTDSPNAKQVTVYDITGKLTDRQTFNDGKIKLDVSNYNTGLYLYSIIGSDNRTLKTGKITVSH